MNWAATVFVLYRTERKMAALLRFSTIVLILFIMPEISPYRIITQNFEPYLQEEIESNASDKEYKRQVNSMLHDNEDRNVKMNLESALKEANYRLQKRNGDLINFLLGLPKGMLDAGRK